jgi:hypothetical protein
LSFLVLLANSFLRYMGSSGHLSLAPLTFCYAIFPSFWFHAHQATFSLWSGFPCSSAHGEGRNTLFLYEEISIWYLLVSEWTLIMIHSLFLKTLPYCLLFLVSLKQSSRTLPFLDMGWNKKSVVLQ